MGQCILNKLTLTSVKGNAESVYRTGQVNLTPANLGAATASHVHGNLSNDGKIGFLVRSLSIFSNNNDSLTS